MRISMKARREMVEAVARRYQQSRKAEKGAILDEFVATSGIVAGMRVMFCAGGDGRCGGRTQDVGRVDRRLWEYGLYVCGYRTRS